MKTVIKIAPAVEPISTALVKTHMRLPASFTTDDTYIGSLITVARKHVENVTWRKLISQTWYLYLDEWPEGDYITLPFGSLQSVTAVVYTDSDNSDTTWSNTEYITDTESILGRIVLGYGESFPSFTAYPSNPIRVEFVCGYGDAGTDLPEDLLHTIKMMVSEMYENREISFANTSFSKSDAFENIISDYRIRF